MAKRIFITGGIGSGKSTLLDFLRSQGVATVEADKVGHEVLTFQSRTGREVRQRHLR